MTRNLALGIATAALLIAASFRTIPAQDKAANNNDCCSLVTRAIDSADKIKKGMTRADVEKEFRTEGGLYTRSEGRYVYKDCPYIKVVVTFEFDSPDRQFAEGAPTDRVKSVSKPYLEYSIMD